MGGGFYKTSPQFFMIIKIRSNGKSQTVKAEAMAEKRIFEIDEVECYDENNIG